jgi:hypothetical protein
MCWCVVLFGLTDYCIPVQGGQSGDTIRYKDTDLCTIWFPLPDILHSTFMASFNVRGTGIADDAQSLLA